MSARLTLLLAVLYLHLPGLAIAAPVSDVVPAPLLTEALKSHDQHKDAVKQSDYLIIIDYREHSATERFYLIDLGDRTAEAHLVAHGKGSDQDHDGYAEAFSNTPNSKMSSLGAFVTGDDYYGRHGLSLRMHGLEAQNDKAEERYIVIHGADYVSPARDKMGRSWGCPALQRDVAERLIPLIKGGSFVYIAGPREAAGS
ncbi:MAG: murein L,D-transpeptidase catalytic domain family protein [Pseudomonadota bacterium]